MAVAARGLWSAALQLASAICRHTGRSRLAAVVFRRAAGRPGGSGARRRGRLGHPPAIADDEGKPIGLLAYLLLKRLDDLAYGLGLWTEWYASARRPAQAADPNLTLSALHAQRRADHRCG